MNNFRTVLQVFGFLIHLLVQVMLFKNMELGSSAFCFMYLGFLLMMPLERDILSLMLIGFVMGIAVDVFYDSLGIHAAASVFTMYVRKYWSASITPQGGYDAGALPSVHMDGLQWWVVYALPLVFVHHLAMFFLEAWGVHLFWYTMKKVVLSTLYTFIVLLIIQFLFYKKGR
jgi:hypothetical protein